METKLCQASNLPERKNLRTCTNKAKATWGKKRPIYSELTHMGEKTHTSGEKDKRRSP